ncbi:hypothetical protein [Asaia sp. VD9]|uniref:hypothetical protein n=1 Tax=Asaia sp. VD9 TaxID=3081235 RepID=UPI00301996E8
MDSLTVLPIKAMTRDDSASCVATPRPEPQSTCDQHGHSVFPARQTPDGGAIGRQEELVSQ